MKTLKESLLDIDSVQSGIDPVKIIDDWCKKNIKGIYKIDPKTLDIDSNGDIEITNKKLIEFPGYIHFGTVRGRFSCYNCPILTSLEGSPKEVGGDFICSYCDNLTSLKGAPKNVGVIFDCSGCKNLTSLEGAPKKVVGYFSCTYCDNLTTLNGAPKVVIASFYCYNCKNLTSLKGAPKEVGLDFYCYNCRRQFTKDDVKKVCNVGSNIVIKA